MYALALRRLSLALLFIGVVAGLGWFTDRASGGMVTAFVQRQIQLSGLKNTQLALLSQEDEGAVQEYLRTQGDFNYLVVVMRFGDTPAASFSDSDKDVFDRVTQYYEYVSGGRAHLSFTFLPKNIVLRGAVNDYTYAPSLIPVSGAPSGESLDEIFCSPEFGGINLTQYHGVVTVFKGSDEQIFAMQREAMKTGDDYALGIASQPAFFEELSDCRSPSAKKFTPLRLVTISLPDKNKNSETLFGSVAHEIGHNFGFGHASARGEEYGNIFDVMGSGALHGAAMQLGGVFLDRAQWLHGNEFVQKDASGGGRIYPLGLDPQKTTQTFARVAKISQNIFAEFRFPVGYDGGVAFEASGVLISEKIEESDTAIILPPFNRHLLRAGECVYVSPLVGVVSIPPGAIIKNQNNPEGSYADIEVSAINNPNAYCESVVINDIAIESPLIVGSQGTFLVTLRNISSRPTERAYGELAVVYENTDNTEGGGQEILFRIDEIAAGGERIVSLPWTPSVVGSVRAEATLAMNQYKPTHGSSQKEYFSVAPAAGQAIPAEKNYYHYNIRADKKVGDGAVLHMSLRHPGQEQGTRFDCVVGTQHPDYCGIDFLESSYVEGTGLGLLSVTPRDHVAVTRFSGAIETEGTNWGWEMNPYHPSGDIVVHLEGVADVTVAPVDEELGDVDVVYQEPGKEERTVCNDCAGQTLTAVAGSRITAIARPVENESEFTSWTGCAATEDDKQTCSTLAPEIGESLEINAVFTPFKEIWIETRGADRSMGEYSIRIKKPGQDAYTLDKPFADGFRQKHPKGTIFTITYRQPQDLYFWRARLKNVEQRAGNHCSGATASSPTCTLTLSEDSHIVIVAGWQHKVEIDRDSPNGDVWVNSEDESEGRAICRDNTMCPASIWIWSGKRVYITASPDDNYLFDRWVGSDCSGQGATCSLILNSGFSAEAVFKEHLFTFVQRKACIHATQFDDYTYCGDGTDTAYFNNKPSSFLGLRGLWSKETYNVNRWTNSDPEPDRYNNGSPNSWIVAYYCDVRPTNLRCEMEGGGRNDVNGDGYITISICEGSRCGLQSQATTFWIYTDWASDDNLWYGYVSRDTLPSGTRFADESTEILPTLSPRAQYAALFAKAQSTLANYRVTAFREKSAQNADEAASLASRQDNEEDIVAAPPSLLARAGIWMHTAWTELTTTLQRAIANNTGRMQAAVLRAAAVGGSPDLVARSIVRTNTAIAPDDEFSFVALVTNESWTNYGEGFDLVVKVLDVNNNLLNEDRVYVRDLGAQKMYSWKTKSMRLGAVGEYRYTFCVDTIGKAIDGNIGNNCEQVQSFSVSTATHTVRVDVAENFGGKIEVHATPSPLTKDCSEISCTLTVRKGTDVIVRAQAADNRVFTDWMGSDKYLCGFTESEASRCAMRNVTKNVVLTANFETVGPAINLTIEGGGAGKVSSTNASGSRNFTNCATTCSKPFVKQTNVTLTATPNAGSYFSAWEGVDKNRCTLSGGGNICTLKTKAVEDIDLRPTFMQGSIPTQKLTVRAFGEGAGAVEVRDPANGDALIGRCESTSCSYDIPVASLAGKQLKVVPLPAVGATFDRFVSPLIDVTKDATWDTGTGCTFASEDRLSDEGKLWVTCENNALGKITLAPSTDVTSITLSSPSAGEGAYHNAIRRAIQRDAEDRIPGASVTFNQQNLDAVYREVLRIEDRNVNKTVASGANTEKEVTYVIENINVDTDLTETDAYLRIEQRRSTGERTEKRVSIPLPGPHHADNQLADIVMRDENGVPLATFDRIGMNQRRNVVIAPGATVTLRGVTSTVLPYMRIDDIQLSGRIKNPCTSSANSICTLTLPRNAAVTVPVTFAKAALGDVDGNGSIQAVDALMALKLAVGQAIPTANATSADVDCRNGVTASDALAILKAATGSLTLTNCTVAQEAVVPRIDIRAVGSAQGGIQATGLESVGSEYRLTFTGNTTANAYFGGWTGDCTGRTSCTITTQGTTPKEVTAMFLNKNRKVSATGPTRNLNVAFEGVTPPTIPTGLLGDVDNDNTLTAVDALAILRASVGQIVPLPNMDRADVDCNGSVQAKDALVVLKAAIGTIPTPLSCAIAAAAPTGNMTFTKTGDGTGTVAPLTPVIRENGTELIFTAAPVPGSSFAGWEGDCTGTGECRVTVNGSRDATLRARFVAEDVTPPPTGNLPDLVTLGDRDLRITPSKPTVNRPLSVLAKIQNQGREYSKSFVAGLRIDQDNNGTWDFADSDLVFPLKVNQSRALKFKKTYTPPTTGTYKIEVCVDDGALPENPAVHPIPNPIPNYAAGPRVESDETNNCQSMTVDVLPERGKAAAAAGALAALTLLVGVPVGLFYLAKVRREVTIKE